MINIPLNKKIAKNRYLNLGWCVYKKQHLVNYQRAEHHHFYGATHGQSRIYSIGKLSEAYLKKNTVFIYTLFSKKK